jgi:hypothetical protein
MNIATNWLSREKTVGEITQKQYFFYYFTEKEKSFKCLGFLKRIKYSGDCCGAICFIFTAILYIPIFFIVDIIDWCCVKERMYYIFLENQDNELKANNFSGVNEFWKVIDNIKFDIYSEDYYLKKFTNIFICSKCKYKSQTFLDFIKPNTNPPNNSMNEIQLLNQSELLAVNFLTIDQRIIYSVPCNSNDKFSSLVNKFLEEYPDIRNKQIFYSNYGHIMDLDKTIRENRIKTGTNILATICEDS